MTDPRTTSDDLLRRCERVLWRTLPTVMHASRDLARQSISEDCQLTPGQHHILRSIQRGTKSISDLAACEKVSLPAISRHVDDLVNMGLVERTRDPDDRRSIMLALTDKGQQMWNEMVERTHIFFSERMKNLSPQEIETIIAGLELLYGVFSSHAPEYTCKTHQGEK